MVSWSIDKPHKGILLEYYLDILYYKRTYFDICYNSESSKKEDWSFVLYRIENGDGREEVR